MAKHAVPKQKQSYGRSNRRYKAFQNSARLKLKGMTNMVPCPNCKELMVQHRACTACGMYKGKDVLGKKKKVEAKVTTIKAE